MALIADLFMIIGAVTVGLYCMILGRKLRKFNDLGSGMGGAVAVLSAQVDDLIKSVAMARESTNDVYVQLRDVTERAENAQRRLELHIASLHDYGEIDSVQNQKQNFNPSPPNNIEPMFVRHKSSVSG